MPQRRAVFQRPLFRRLVFSVGALALLPFLLTLLYAVIPPPASALMVLRLVGGTVPHYDWVPLEDIAPTLPLAVIASEDQRFCEHDGIDWVAVNQVIEDDASRGASTITMQLAKNLFLWPGRSYIRKALEVPLAYWLDLVLSKRRVIEIYLNVVEFGEGIYGAEEAARRHFDKSAKQLTRRESALLAAVLPDPLGRNASKPGRLTNRMASLIQRRMSGIGPYAACVTGAD
ncbi:monofunctional biosynthetic peptidoglycan transglycosylase [Rhodoligotrophos appendicifer]|uniref:monofunctional biosynthetic peptidoglycan transglycosylase n=1 Tax=Rhodoligotrophos appendicifer TaxID=987056 RepID=UPI001185D9F1|nr:monofunctional biosynthetic peptidoglycan transglycosylase [Rhodoligotrophos appendicifer]